MTLALAAGIAASLALQWIASAFYSRFHSTRDLLENGVRKRILELAKEKPGILVRELADHVQLARKTVEHHLGLMRERGLVQVVMVGRTRHVYLPGEAPTTLPAPGRIQQRIIDVLSAFPNGLSRSDLAQHLPGVPKQTKDDGVRKLITKGIVHETRHGKLSILRLVENATL